jgi:hypothetical protein
VELRFFDCMALKFKDGGLLGCCAVYSSKGLPTFRVYRHAALQITPGWNECEVTFIFFVDLLFL